MHAVAYENERHGAPSQDIHEHSAHLRAVVEDTHLTTSYSVGILGAGQIAQGYDHPGDDHVLSMAHAISKSSHFHLGGFFDTDSSRTLAAEERWHCPLSPRDRSTWLKEPWDVIYIATPDDHHKLDLLDALAARPKAILIEKPLTTDADDIDGLLDVLTHAKIPVMMNCPRRHHPGTHEIAQWIRGGHFGKATAIVMSYSNGLLHNGIHLLDLFAQWWGADWEVRFIHEAKHVKTFELHQGNIALPLVLLEPSAHIPYIFELHAYGTHGKVEISQSPEKMLFAESFPHPLYHDFHVFRTVGVFDMEAGSLLNSVLNDVHQSIQDPVYASDCLEREMRSQRFIRRFANYSQQFSTEALS